MRLLLACLLLLSSATALQVDVPATPAASEGSKMPAAARPEAGAGAPGSREIEFVCPRPQDGVQELRTSAMHVVYTCPMRIYDFAVAMNQGWLFGNIDLALGPTPEEVAFFTLHGGPVRDGPSPYSRDSLTHSIFSTATMGIDWTDSWTAAGYPSQAHLGEWSSGAFTPDGSVVAAFTWARRDGSDSLVRVMKLPGVQDSRSYMSLYEEQFHEFAGDPGMRIEHAHAAFVAGADTGLDAPRPARFGDPADNGTKPGAVALVFQQTPQGKVGDPLAEGFIDAAWTHAGPSNSAKDWVRLPREDRIGPCSDSSDPVAWAGRVYVACVVAPGYDARRGARVGDIDVWSFQPGANGTRLEGHADIAGDEPRLAATPDGYFALAASRLVAEQQVDVRVAVGWHGGRWQEVGRGLGPLLHRGMGGHPMHSAQVTAVAVTEDTRTVFLVYKEFHDVPPEGAVHPGDPGQVRLMPYRKFAVTLDACEAPIAGAEFVLGTSPDLYQRQAYEMNPGVFDDRRDGLEVRRMPDGQELVFFAVGDYGAAQYGAMVGTSGAAGGTCAFTPAVPEPVVPIVPQAASLTQAANLYVAAGAGVAALAMVAYLLTVKRRNPLLSVAEDR